MSGKAMKTYQKVHSPNGSVCSNPDDDQMSAASPKRGRKESEQRRRVLMNQYFDELVMLLSMVSEKDIPRKMDKVTTLREAVNCIQVYFDLCKSTQQEKTKNTKSSKSAKASPPQNKEVEQCLLDPGRLLNFFIDSYDMFMVVVTETGRILYSTELITSLLGHLQTRLVGQNIFDFVHPDDQTVIQELFSRQGEKVKMKNSPVIAYAPKSFDCRFQLYSGETGCFPQYLPFLCFAFLREWDQSAVSQSPPSPLSEDAEPSPCTERPSCLIVLGKLPTTFTLIDLPVGTNDVNFEFEMRITCEGRIIDVEKHAPLIFGYMDYEIVGSSFFEYIDPYHILDVGEGLSTILSSGLGTTTPYRMLTKGKRFVWLISKGYVSYNPWNNKPDHILLRNRALGSDQVLPEHRFFRSRKLLPDTDGNECYVPTPIKPETTPTPIQPAVSVQAPPPSTQLQSTSSLSSSHSTLHNISTPAQPQTLLQQQQTSSLMNPSLGNLPGLQLPPDIALLLSAPPSPSPTPTLTQTMAAQSITDIRRQLEQKNQELFELQRKLLEQQMLFEKERNQFYMVTQQVMRCITSVNSLPISTHVDMLTKTSCPMSTGMNLTSSHSNPPATCSDMGMTTWCDALMTGNVPIQQTSTLGSSIDLHTPPQPQLPISHLPSIPDYTTAADTLINKTLPTTAPSISAAMSQRQPVFPVPSNPAMSHNVYGSQPPQSLGDYNTALFNQLQQQQQTQPPHTPTTSILDSLTRSHSLADILGIHSCHS